MRSNRSCWSWGLNMRRTCSSWIRSTVSSCYRWRRGCNRNTNWSCRRWSRRASRNWGIVCRTFIWSMRSRLRMYKRGCSASISKCWVRRTCGCSNWMSWAVLGSSSWSKARGVSRVNYSASWSRSSRSCICLSSRMKSVTIRKWAKFDRITESLRCSYSNKIKPRL